MRKRGPAAWVGVWWPPAGGASIGAGLIGARACLAGLVASGWGGEQLASAAHDINFKVIRFHAVAPTPDFRRNASPPVKLEVIFCVRGVMSPPCGPW